MLPRLPLSQFRWLLASFLTLGATAIESIAQDGMAAPQRLPAETEIAKPASLKELKEIQEKVKAIYQKNLPATVSIVGVKNPGSGSGVIVNKAGLILTAAHVTAAAGKELTIIFPDGKRVKGVSLGANRGTDAGFAKITESGDYPFVPMGDSNKLAVGDWLVSMGHPGGFDRNRKPPVRLGRLWHRDVEGGIISDCTLIGGDSGGPLFDLEGKVVGIHSSIHMNLRHNRHIALDHFIGDWEELLKDKAWGSPRYNGFDRRRPKLGVTLDRKTQSGGVGITDVPAESLAAKAGLKTGDKIVQVNSTEVANSWAFMRELSDCKPGQTVKLKLKRADETVEVKMQLLDGEGKVARKSSKKSEPKAKPAEEKWPFEMPERPKLGLTLEPTEDSKGLNITAVAPDSLASKAGLKAGDLLLKMQGRPTNSLDDATNIYGDVKPDSDLSFQYRRDGKLEEAELKRPKPSK
jgi:serine protease Do